MKLKRKFGKILPNSGGNEQIANHELNSAHKENRAMNQGEAVASLKSGGKNLDSETREQNV